MDTLSNCLLNIYVYIHRLVLSTALIKKIFSLEWLQFIEKPGGWGRPGAENRWQFSAQCQTGHPRHPLQSPGILGKRSGENVRPGWWKGSYLDDMAGHWHSWAHKSSGPPNIQSLMGDGLIGLAVKTCWGEGSIVLSGIMTMLQCIPMFLLPPWLRPVGHQEWWFEWQWFP